MEDKKPEDKKIYDINGKECKKPDKDIVWGGRNNKKFTTTK